MGSVAVTGLGRRNLVVVIVAGFLVFGAVKIVELISTQPPHDLIAKSSLNQNTKIGRIGSGFFDFEIADTPEKRIKGLSGRTSFSETNGLLFVFDPDDKTQCIVMRDMKFNIDILWFDTDKNLVHEKRNVSPDTYPAQFCPPQQTAYVVELAAGVAENNHIKLGDKLHIEL